MDWHVQGYCVSDPQGLINIQKPSRRTCGIEHAAMIKFIAWLMTKFHYGNIIRAQPGYKVKRQRIWKDPVGFLTFLPSHRTPHRKLFPEQRKWRQHKAR